MATSAASRPRPPGRCTPARWSRHWHRGWTRARTAGAGWCASKTSTRRAACRAPTRRSSRSSRACGLVPDEPPLWQSRARRCYQAALDRLVGRAAGPIPAAARGETSSSRWSARGLPKQRHGELVYPGTCRDGLHGKPARAMRLRTVAGRARGRRADRLAATAASARNGSACARPSATSCCSAPTACGPTSSPWWSTMRRRASPTSCAAKTWPTTRRGRSCCSARSGCPRRATCTRRWCSAPTARSCPSRTAPRRSTSREPLAGPARAPARVLGIDAERLPTLAAFAGAGRRSAWARTLA